jgi:mannose-6-phosphate isomerase
MQRQKRLRARLRQKIPSPLLPPPVPLRPREATVVLYPLTFHPIFKSRVWGGRNLERLYGKKLPPGEPIGESWEITDRPGDVSVIANGPLAGKDLRWLVENHRDELLGDAKLLGGRFPLLIKLLDAQEKLSLQVHPPASKAAELGGEPKTEMWYIAHAAPGAELYVGLKRGVTRAVFEKKIQAGTVADCFHHIPVKAGDAMFLPSGRVHAIGAGLVIFEIQQNSDTTYRVFDWNRVGLDGKPRELHVPQSLASIDFADFEPPLVQNRFTGDSAVKHRPLVDDPLFAVEILQLTKETSVPLPPRKMQIIACLNGNLRIISGATDVVLSVGEFCLVPACLMDVAVWGQVGAALLRAEGGNQG